MVQLNFCESCGDKHVNEVKTELEELFKKKELDPSTCGICCSLILQERIVTDVESKFARGRVSIIGTDEIRSQEAKCNLTDEPDNYVVLEEPMETFDEDNNDSDEGSNYSDEISTYKNKTDSSNSKRKTISDSTKTNPFMKKSPVDISELESKVQGMILEESVKPNLFLCKMCKKSFKRSARGVNSFVNHISSHTGQELIGKPYRCPECNYPFKNHCSLRSHMTSHQKVKVKECPYPECDFKAKRSMKTHVDIVHRGIKKKVQKKKHICQICGRVLEYGQSLKKHLMRHQGLKPCKCDECGKCFLDTANLVRHKERHKSLKSTICEVCGKSFHDVPDLNVHLVTHSDNRIYPCEFCPYRAKRLGNLKAHIKNIHTESDRDKCKCSYCGQHFVSAGACTRHEKKHQGGLELAEALLKPYQCPDCGYRATKPCKVRIHRRAHTGEKPYKCTYCERAFTQNGQCKKHMRVCKQR